MVCKLMYTAIIHKAPQYEELTMALVGSGRRPSRLVYAFGFGDDRPTGRRRRTVSIDDRRRGRTAHGRSVGELRTLRLVSEMEKNRTFWGTASARFHAASGVFSGRPHGWKLLEEHLDVGFPRSGPHGARLPTPGLVFGTWYH